MSSENGEDKLQRLEDWLARIARATTNTSEQQRLFASGVREDLGQLNGGQLVVHAALARIEERLRWDITNISPEELADRVPHDTICKARNINWARRNGEPDPLPDAPKALRRSDEDTDRFPLATGAQLELSRARQKQIVGVLLKLIVGAVLAGGVYLAGLLHGKLVH